MHTFITVYFAIGIIYSIGFDMLLRRSKAADPLTILEFLSSITFWPFVLSIFIRESLNSKK